jgi:hypothetical protein
VAACCGGLVVWLLARLERHMSRASAADRPDPAG